MARHTFAATVTLGNGVPIEIVSKMIGHTNIKTKHAPDKRKEIKAWAQERNMIENNLIFANNAYVYETYNQHNSLFNSITAIAGTNKRRLFVICGFIRLESIRN